MVFCLTDVNPSCSMSSHIIRSIFMKTLVRICQAADFPATDPRYGGAKLILILGLVLYGLY